MGSGSNSSSLYKIKSRVDMYEKAKNGPGNLNKIPGANRHSYLLDLRSLKSVSNLCL